MRGDASDRHEVKGRLAAKLRQDRMGDTKKPQLNAFACPLCLPICSALPLDVRDFPAFMSQGDASVKPPVLLFAATLGLLSCLVSASGSGEKKEDSAKGESDKLEGVWVEVHSFAKEKPSAAEPQAERALTRGGPLERKGVTTQPTLAHEARHEVLSTNSLGCRARDAQRFRPADVSRPPVAADESQEHEELLRHQRRLAQGFQGSCPGPDRPPDRRLARRGQAVGPADRVPSLLPHPQGGLRAAHRQARRDHRRLDRYLLGSGAVLDVCPARQPRDEAVGTANADRQVPAPVPLLPASDVRLPVRASADVVPLLGADRDQRPGVARSAADGGGLGLPATRQLHHVGRGLGPRSNCWTAN